jgi:threonine aldolase
MTYVADKLPQCSSGGRCLSVEYTDRVGEVAKKHGLKLHIDGARIFNASVVSQFVFYL